MPDVWRHGSFKASKWLPPPLQLLPWLAFPIAPANAAFTAVTAFAVPMTPLHSLLLNGLEGGGAGAFSSPTGGGARLAAAAAACRPVLERAQNSHCPSSQHSPAANGWLAAASGPAWPSYWLLHLLHLLLLLLLPLLLLLLLLHLLLLLLLLPLPLCHWPTVERLAIGCCSMGWQPSLLLPPSTSRCV